MKKLILLFSLLLISVISICQTIDGALKTLVASGTNTYTVSESLPSGYLLNERFIVRFTNGNTGASTLNRNSLGAKAIVKNGATALASGDISAGQQYIVSYNGTNYNLVGSVGGSGGGGWATTGTTTLTGAATIAGTSTNTIKYSFPSLGLSPVNGAGLWLDNPTAATSSVGQGAPSFVLSGNGWKTNATAASQSTKYRINTFPTNAATAPTNWLQLGYSINNAAYVEQLTINSLGSFQFTDPVGGGTLLFDHGTYGSTDYMALSANKTTIGQSVTAASTLTGSGLNLDKTNAVLSAFGGSSTAQLVAPVASVNGTSIASLESPVIHIGFQGTGGSVDFAPDGLNYPGIVDLRASDLGDWSAGAGANQQLGMNQVNGVILQNSYASGTAKDNLWILGSTTGETKLSGYNLLVGGTDQQVTIGTDHGSAQSSIQFTQLGTETSTIIDNEGSTGSGFVLVLDPSGISSQGTGAIFQDNRASKSGIELFTTGAVGLTDYSGFTNYTLVPKGYVSARQLTATATLDFPSTTSTTVADLTITVTGAAVGDAVSIGVPNGSVTTTGSFYGWVSATNTVKIRFSPKATEDPASGTFRATVHKP